MLLSTIGVSVHNGDLIGDKEVLVWLSKNRFLCIKCPKISLFFLLFFFVTDGAHLRMENFSRKQSLHTLSLGASGFTFLTTSHDLFKLNLVLNSFSVSLIYVSWSFEVVSVTVALYTTH